MVQDQSNLKSLKALGTEVMDWITQILSWPEQDMYKNLGTVPGIPFLNFVKFAITNFILNCMRTCPYDKNDERTSYCEIFIPLFKAFGNTTKTLNYSWQALFDNNNKMGAY